MDWRTTPMVFREPEFGELCTTYPVNVIGYNDDGTVLGIIDEERLGTVKRILLEAALS